MTSFKNAHLSMPSKDWEDFYNADPSAVPTLVGTPEQLRGLMTTLKATAKASGLVKIVEEGLTVKDFTVPTSDGSSIQCRTYTPTSGDGDFPALLYLHGGGWVLGDIEESDPLCRAICVNASIVVVNVDYRLAPEHPFPAAINDAWDSFQWTITNAETLRIDKTRIIVGGSSAGGNLAAALTHRALTSNPPHKIHGQILRVPATCHPSAYPAHLELNSMTQNASAPILSAESMRLCYSYYLPKASAGVETDLKQTDLSPLCARSFAGLPRAYVQVAGADPLRDEGLAYVQELRAGGVEVRVDVYPGMPHAFNFFPQLAASRKNGVDLLGAVNWLVGK